MVLFPPKLSPNRSNGLTHSGRSVLIKPEFPRQKDINYYN